MSGEYRHHSVGYTGGSALALFGSSTPLIDCSILAFSQQGESITCLDGTSVPTIVCCDIFGNPDGDWIDCIEDHFGVNGNISLDPQFCFDGNPSSPFSLQATSSCAEENNPECGQIGAFGIGCDVVSVPEEQSLPVDWGTLKATY